METTHMILMLTFSVDIDELVSFELYYPSTGAIELTPQSQEQYEIRIYNNGSETVEFTRCCRWLAFTTSITSESGVNVTMVE